MRPIRSSSAIPPTFIVLLALAPTLPLPAQATTTVITHGYQLDGNFPDWPVAMGSRIADLGTPQGTVLVQDPVTGSWSPVYGSGDPAGPIVLCFDWAEASAWAPGSTDRVGTAIAAADALFAALRDPTILGGLAGESVLETASGDPRPLHIIGHSRGASVNTAVAERLSLAGIPIDHLTALDPHPIGPSADLLDPALEVFEGVEFADNYYRADGCDIDFGCFSFDFNGEPIAGAYNVDLGLDAFGFFDNRLAPCTLEHILVHSWYHGTIDLLAGDDGDCSIDRGNWYAMGGAGEGHFLSVVGGGAAQRPCGPGGGCPDAGRVVPSSVPAVVNGDFSFGAGHDAGWLWQGGGGSGAIIEIAGNPLLELSGGATSRRHNPLFLPDAASALTFEFEITEFDAFTSLEVVLIDDGVETLLDVVPLDAVTPWTVRTVDLTSLPRDRTVALEVRIPSAATVAVVRLDDFDLTMGVPGTPIRRGDCNADASINLADAIFGLGVIFGTQGAPPCLSTCDANDDGSVDISDPITILEALFIGGTPIAPPSPACGTDPTADPLPCPTFGGC